MPTTPVLLELDLGHGLLESPPADPVSAFRTRNTPVLGSVIERLREAAGSDAVGGLIAHLGAGELSASQVEELGAAIEALGAAGKRTVAWTESFGEGGNGTLAYHLAAHFDEIWVQPSGDLALLGAAAGATFLRGALERVGVEPQIHARHEYKNAPDSLMRETMGEPQREALQALTDALTDGVVATVARRRGASADDVRAAIAASPLSPADALERGLIDKIGYRDEAYASATGGDDDMPKRFVHKWALPPRERAEKVARRGAKRLRRRGESDVIAVVTVDGGIMTGRSGSGPLGGARAGSDSITAALRSARADDQVAAVVLRVVSPGGSYVASDAVHREVLRLREAGKPVVASFGTVAASGGYFVAMGADEILALPGTITGSIGVFAGKVVIGEALRRVGVNQELVSTGERSTIWSPSQPFTKDQAAWLDAWLDTVYADFTQKAADGRGMPIEQLEPLARGRVWSGTDAKERGLVDRLGGLDEAITVAAEKAGRARADVEPRRYPHASPVARLRSPQSSDSPGAALAASWTRGTATGGLLEGFAAGPERLLAELAIELGIGPGALRLPALQLR